VLFADVVAVSGALAETRSKTAKVDALDELLRRLAPDEIVIAVGFLVGTVRPGRVGIGWATLRDVEVTHAPVPTLTVHDVDRGVAELAATTGAGSVGARRAQLATLLTRATEAESDFLRRLLLGELRQGALEGVMSAAVAKAAGVPADEIRRATMLSGDLAEVAAAAVRDGSAGLTHFRLTPLRPLQPMLAQTADDLEDAFVRIRPAFVEWKLDGARIQVHRAGDEVRAFTRNLADITDRVPEIVGAVRALPVDAIVLDGEAIALGAAGRPLPFQETMSRFGSKVNVDELREKVPLSAFFFDVLHLDGEDLIDRPASERLGALDERLPEELRVRRIETADPAEAQRFLEAALAHGHEGVMVKSLDAPYEAGRRGLGWLKVKIAHTLDLVVLAVEWGHGRRQGKLSNLHLGARDPEADSFVMLGKTFKGMTDEMLVWQTEHLLTLKTEEKGHVVHVRPELVVEIAFDGVQSSTRYPGGVALRFARVKGYRPDKRPDEADTIDTVRALHAGGG
jgi:DNA ligase 1